MEMKRNHQDKHLQWPGKHNKMALYFPCVLTVFYFTNTAKQRIKNFTK